MSFWLGTFFFVLLECAFVAWVQLRRTTEKPLKHTLYGTAVFCCWVSWAMVYASQIHTLTAFMSCSATRGLERRLSKGVKVCKKATVTLVTPLQKSAVLISSESEPVFIQFSA